MGQRTVYYKPTNGKSLTATAIFCITNFSGLTNALGKNEGIEYVLSVIEEMKTNKSDLILNVERHVPNIE